MSAPIHDALKNPKKKKLLKSLEKPRERALLTKKKCNNLSRLAHQHYQNAVEFLPTTPLRLLIRSSFKFSSSSSPPDTTQHSSMQQFDGRGEDGTRLAAELVRAKQKADAKFPIGLVQNTMKNIALFLFAVALLCGANALPTIISSGADSVDCLNGITCAQSQTCMSNRTGAGMRV